MNTKRFCRCFFIYMLAFLMLSCSAWAVSIFDLIPDPDDTLSHAAVNYGNCSGMEPDLESKNKLGDTVLAYYNVSPEDFNSFGVYLNERSYYVTEQVEEGGQYAYGVTDGIVSLSLVYDSRQHVLNMIYPEGTGYEELMFPGYKRVRFGEPVSLKEYGKFTFEQFQMKSSGLKTNNMWNERDNNNSKYQEPFAGAMLSYQYLNTSGHKKNTIAAKQDEEVLLYSVRLVYQNGEDNMVFQRKYNTKVFDGMASRLAGEVKINEQTEMGLTFELPEDVINSVGGNLGFTFEDKFTGDKYVLVLRENGKNLY